MLEWLKTILGEGYSEEIDKKVSAEIGKSFVARTDFNTVKQENGRLKDDLSAKNGEIETLKQAGGDTVELQKTIDGLKKEIDDTRRTHALTEKLAAMGVTDPGYIIYKHGGVDKFSFDKDGQPEKLDDVLAPYKENAATAHLFGSTTQHYTPAGGKTPATNPFAKDTFNMTEQGRLLKENRAAAQEMAAAAGVTLNL